MKHTPGPWQIVKNTGAYCEIYSSEGFVAKARLQDTDFNEANAHLIAAAPDLLHAIEGLNTLIYYAVDQKNLTADAKRWIKDAQLAVAKARGSREP